MCSECNNVILCNWLFVAELTLKHQAELKAVEEAAKQATVKYFMGEIDKLEALYRKQLEELQSRLKLNLIESLEKALLDKTKEVGFASLKVYLIRLD